MSQTTDGERGGLIHESAFYSSPEQFVSTVVPFVREGIAAAEPVLVVTEPSKFELIGSALDEDSDAVQFEESRAWYVNPAKASAAYDRWATEMLNGAAARVRIVGEIPWTDRRDPAVREWTRYESFLNVGFEQLAVSVLCPYDAAALPSGTVIDAHRTHRSIRRDGGGSAPSEMFTQPHELSRQLDEAPLREPMAETRELTLTHPTDLRRLRAFLGEHAGATPLSDERVADLALAANEIATNALLHGGGAGRVRVCRDNGDLLMDVVDRGDGIQDPFPGYRPPLDRAVGGWGLWLTRQLCDLVEVRSGPSGTTVRLHMAIAS